MDPRGARERRQEKHAIIQEHGNLLLDETYSVRTSDHRFCRRFLC